MEDLESKLRGILGDPEAMAGILDMARSLGLQPPDGGGSDEAPSDDAPPPPPGGISDTVAGLLSAAGRMDGKQTALLQALRPFIKESRRVKIDRAVQAARISRIAGDAIRNLGTTEQGR